jgi:hypothetical protein
MVDIMENSTKADRKIMVEIADMVGTGIMVCTGCGNKVVADVGVIITKVWDFSVTLYHARRLSLGWRNTLSSSRLKPRVLRNI